MSDLNADSGAYVARRGACLAMHHFPRMPGHHGADAVCEKPDGHADAHEGVVGRSAYCWSNSGAHPSRD